MGIKAYLDFEKPIADLEGKIAELRSLGSDEGGVRISDDIARMEAKSEQALKDIYSKLTPWQKTQVARHPYRPHFKDYIGQLITDFMPLAGDRSAWRWKATTSASTATSACTVMARPPFSRIS